MLVKQSVLACFLVTLVIAVVPVPVLSQEEGCAHVIDGTASEQSPGVWLVSATVSSTETGWDKYADEWIISLPVDEDFDETTVLGTRTLAHPHVNEQPFTRSLSGVVIPGDVSTVVLSARDSVLGYCGDSYELSLGRKEQETESPNVANTTSGSNTNGTTTTDSTGMFLFNETLANSTARPVSPPSNSSE